MPTYQYNCDNCKFIFSEMTAIVNRDKVICPQCGRLARKMFTPIGAIYIGDGFYVNDYKKEKLTD